MNANVVEVAACCAAVLLALAIGYYAGTRRRPARHGTIQLRTPRHRRRR